MIDWIKNVNGAAEAPFPPHRISPGFNLKGCWHLTSLAAYAVQALPLLFAVLKRKMLFSLFFLKKIFLLKCYFWGHSCRRRLTYATSRTNPRDNGTHLFKCNFIAKKAELNFKFQKSLQPKKYLCNYCIIWKILKPWISLLMVIKS